jgi:hypothetical protein
MTISMVIIINVVIDAPPRLDLDEDDAVMSFAS